MTNASIENLARTVMYEGYNLYPYRPTSLKNTYRWMFGCIYPNRYTQATGGLEPCILGTQCLVDGTVGEAINIQCRFLQVASTNQSRNGRVIERVVSFHMSLAPCNSHLERFVLTDSMIPDVDVGDLYVKEVQGEVSAQCEQLADATWIISIEISNHSNMPSDPSILEDAQARLLASTHVVVVSDRAKFLSMIDPPEQYREFVSGIEQNGLWPILAGDRDACNALLALPIILEDFPSLAPQSMENLFDSTEIDELLTMRIRTMTDHEKREAAQDPRTRRIIERADAMTDDQLAQLHGTWRGCKPHGQLVKTTSILPGDRVRIEPRNNSDAMDVLLRGRTATVLSVEQDFEARAMVAVTIDDDPGSDLGIEGKVGHRFYFHSSEVKRIDGGETV